MTEPWVWNTIPPGLVAIHDAPGGTSLVGLADILNAYDALRRNETTRCGACGTTALRFDPPVNVEVDKTPLCGAFKPGRYAAGMEVPVCLLKEGHGPDEMHWGVVEYEVRWTDGGLEWVGKDA